MCVWGGGVVKTRSIVSVVLNACQECEGMFCFSPTRLCGSLSFGLTSVSGQPSIRIRYFCCNVSPVAWQYLECLTVTEPIFT